MERGKAEKKAGGQRAHAPAGPPAGERRFYKIGDVCEMTDTQPYVLRFWESEFPQLAPRKSRAGQRVYEQKDVDLVVRIKQLLYEEEYTIAGARKKLEEEGFLAAPATEEGRAAARGKPAATEPARAAGGPSAAERRMAAALRALRQELSALKAKLES